jgi:hypothetical protein
MRPVGFHWELRPGCRDIWLARPPRPAADGRVGGERPDRGVRLWPGRNDATNGRLGGAAAPCIGRAASGQPVEVDEEVAQLGEALRAELLRPLGLQFGDRLPDDANRVDAAVSKHHTLGAQVVGVRLAP